YQRTADDIVGKMTVAAIDRELVAHEEALPRRARIEVIAPRKPVVITNQAPVFLGLTAINHGYNAKTGSAIDSPNWPNHLFGPTVSTRFMELAVGGTGTFRVDNAKGALLSISDSRLAYVYDPNLQNAHGNFIGIYKDSL